VSESFWIFLGIVGLIIAVQLLRWAAHKHRNKVLGVPSNVEVADSYDREHLSQPADPGLQRGLRGPGIGVSRLGWGNRTGDINPPRRDGYEGRPR
jgi:hypothetical protein